MSNPRDKNQQDHTTDRLRRLWMRIIHRRGYPCPPGIGPGMPAHTWGNHDTCLKCGAKRGIAHGEHIDLARQDSHA